jgi:hypothetical protein
MLFGHFYGKHLGTPPSFWKIASNEVADFANVSLLLLEIKS